MAVTQPIQAAWRAAATARQTYRNMREWQKRVAKRIPGHKVRRRGWRYVVLPLLVLMTLMVGVMLAVEEDEQQAQADQELLMQLAALCGTGTGTGRGTVNDGTPSVLGSSMLTAAQIKAWWHSKMGEPANLNAPIDQLIDFYVAEGTATGVRADVAFAQAIHETGWFSNADSLVNNYAGIGNTDGSGGHGYDSPRQGVRAHLDLLKSYTTGSGPGQAQSWGQVGNDWSGTDSGAGYWAQVRPLWEEMLRHAGVDYRSSTERPTGSGSGISQGSRSGDEQPSGGDVDGPGSGGQQGSGSGISQGSRSSNSLPAGMDLERTLATIRRIESGSYQGNYTLDHRGGDASGAYGFRIHTWGRYRGYAEARNAPPSVQDTRAREHLHELLGELDGPSWELEAALGWFLGSPTATPLMTLRDGDPRWGRAADSNGTTPRQYLQRFQRFYEDAPGNGGGRGAGTAGMGCPAGLAGVGGAGTPTTTERQRIIQRAKTWLTAVNGGPVPYDQEGRHDGWRTDCSGFVSMAWELDESETTYTLPNFSREISRDQLQPGDVMNKRADPGAHVILFEHWMDGSRDRFMAIEQASSSRGTVRRPHSYSDLHRQGYRPLTRANTE